jgi:P27 family predicted phage terminase small subunit
MPTPPKTLENIKKHLTNSEREARQVAEDELQRKKRPQIRCPKWLDQDAREIFEGTKKRLKGLQLLDSADAELLAIYSDAVAKYRTISKLLDHAKDAGSMTTDEDAKDAGSMTTDEDVKNCQSWARLVAAYAEKLGLTPTARARLAKRKAEKQAPDELEELLDNPEKW